MPLWICHCFFFFHLFFFFHIPWSPDDNSRLVYRIDLKFCTLIHSDTRKKPIVWGGPLVTGSGGPGVVNRFPDDNSRLVYRIDLKFCTLIHNDTRKKPIVWGGPPVTGSGGHQGWSTGFRMITRDSFIVLIWNRVHLSIMTQRRSLLFGVVLRWPVEVVARGGQLVSGW